MEFQPIGTLSIAANRGVLAKHALGSLTDEDGKFLRQPSRRAWW
jgi:hypothetical protein